MSVGKNKHLDFVRQWISNSDLNYAVICGSYHRARELLIELKSIEHILPVGVCVKKAEMQIIDGDRGGSLSYIYTKNKILGCEIQGVWFDESTPWNLKPIVTCRLRPKHDQMSVHPRSNGIQLSFDEDDMISQYDKRPLPDWWNHCVEKIRCIRLLQQGMPLDLMPLKWRNASYHDRMRIIHHLVAVGSVTENALRRLLRPRTTLVYKPETLDWHDVARVPVDMDAKRAWLAGEWITHLPPNGGKRILASGYTQLKDYWVRANGTAIYPAQMDSNHLKNSINLLRESYMNLIARSTELMGKVHAQFDNPVVRTAMENAHHEVLKMEIDDVYPIFNVLVKELQSRKPLPVIDPEVFLQSDGSFSFED